MVRADGRVRMVLLGVDQQAGAGVVEERRLYVLLCGAGILRDFVMAPAGDDRALRGRGSWWGLVFFAISAAMQWASAYFNFEWFPEASIVPFFAGVTLFVGGWQGFRWAWPAVLFLVFMVPLPGAVEGMVRYQLQRLATNLSVWIIQTVGIPSVPDGVVIHLTDKPLRVAEACSGLRMMSLFFAACVGAAFVVRKPLWEKIVMIGSAVPIAVASNVARIVLTAVLCEIGRQWPSVIAPDRAEKLVHDAAGLLMPIIGLLLLWAEMTLLSKLLVAPPARTAFGRRQAGG